MLIPQLVTSLRTYDRQQAIRDITAGIIVGIVALPLAIAFAIASESRRRRVCTRRSWRAS